MTLHECLSGYTKVRLAEVGAAYDYSIPQSKKKGDIVDFLTAVIKSDMIRYFSEEGSSYTAAVYDILQNSRPVIREEDLESIQGPLDKGRRMARMQVLSCRPMLWQFLKWAEKETGRKPEKNVSSQKVLFIRLLSRTELRKKKK